MTMLKNQKQLKITKLFRKGNKRPRTTKENDENSELKQEIEDLEQKLREKQDYLFQLQRESYRQKLPVPKKRCDILPPLSKSFILNHCIETSQKTLDLATMLMGMKVESYGQDHCSVVFQMQLENEYDVKHGVTISLVDDEYKITNYSLPPGFDLKTLLDGCNTEMSSKTFSDIRKALTAYYSRLQQYNDLQVFLRMDGTLFKLMDGTQIEITFMVKNELGEQNDPTESLTFILYYTMYGIRPIDYAFKGLTDTPQEALREQFLLFKEYPLTKAFKIAFIDGDGVYKLVRHLGGELVAPRRRRARRRPAPGNDDTFRAEDCSESSDDDDADD